ncbi:MAG: T9SS type A sorting domain-containing protein [Candidatus Marinimicrobia bacterium]|nr:T9SS type A sorting domain-containing protein [Candidatus Neomarinimicrobiota bacterium]
MKSFIITLSLFSIAFATSVTFQVDMSNETVDSTGVHIAGSMQGWDPALSELTDTDGDGVYEITFDDLTAGDEHYYTFLNGNSWGGQEDNTGLGDCGVDNGFGGYNRVHVVGETDETVGPVCFSSCLACGQVNITFQVDMTNEEVSLEGVHIAGSMQGWDPAATALSAVGDSVYAVTLAVASGETVFYKFINGNAWGSDEGVPSDCATDGNRTFTPGDFDETLDAVCFGSCEGCTPPNVVEATVTFQADMSNMVGFDPALDTLEVRGSFNGWGGGDALSPDLVDPNLYVLSVTFSENVGNEVAWKFKANPDEDWNNTGWETGDNRIFSWTGEDMTLDPAQPNILPTGEDLQNDVTISFEVEWIDGTLNANTGEPFVQKPDTMVFNGSYLNGWYTWGDCMGSDCETPASPDMPRLTDDDGDDVFTGTLSLPAGHSNLFMAKFGAWYPGIEVDAPGSNGAVDNEAGFGTDRVFLLPVDVAEYSFTGRFGENNPDNEWPTGVAVNIENYSGWNLVGLPVGVDDGSWTEIYPASVPGTLYEFTGTYENVSTLVPGNGYWLNFPDAGNTIVTGSPISNITINLSQGWNLFSGISDAVDLSNISDPDEIIVPGTIYGFTGTYTGPSEITPGKGYWVNASSSGTITISSNGTARTSAAFTDRTVNSNRLSFNGSDLFFGVAIPEVELPSYQLPPKPPAGSMDARFTDNMKITNSNGLIEVMNNSDRLTISYTINIDAGDQLRWVLTSDDGNEFELYDSGEIVVSGDVSGFSLNRVPVIPLTYAVSQNYPNPFNPVTSISFELPNDNFVKISVYNIMGQKVTDLVNGLHSAGYHQTLWNSTNTSGDPVSSGVYIYTVEAGDFIAIKKMILMK